jgi:hypothetical protein
MEDVTAAVVEEDEVSRTAVRTTIAAGARRNPLKLRNIRAKRLECPRSLED